ncbi:MAG: M20/M25/M40 family metallo-hydrolase [Magnetococcales bacterium]|nr:M20/M25/M40 family metallo-hydrolase [Magnetococcales bacterium]
MIPIKINFINWVSWRILSRFSILAIIAICFLFFISMPSRSFDQKSPVLTKEEQELRVPLEQHIKMLAETIGERNLWHENSLRLSVNYIKSIFESYGYFPVEKSFTLNKESIILRLENLDAPEEFIQANMVKLPEKMVVSNIEAELPGLVKDEIVIVGAHYDSVFGSPGANDNASGVAAILELARILKNNPQRRTVRFVAFVNEEPPFFDDESMGSRVYALEVAKKKEKIVSMYSLETIGWYSDEPKSQKYPIPLLNPFYPSKGNFLGFVGNFSSWSLLRQSVGSFRRHTPFPSEGLAAPEWVEGINWSDHASFWNEGIPAIMVTDTAYFRYPFYHKKEDTPDRIDFSALARVVFGLSKVLAD